MINFGPVAGDKEQTHQQTMKLIIFARWVGRIFIIRGILQEWERMALCCVVDCSLLLRGIFHFNISF